MLITQAYPFVQIYIMYIRSCHVQRLEVYVNFASIKRKLSSCKNLPLVDPTLLSPVFNDESLVQLPPLLKPKFMPLGSLFTFPQI